MTTAQSKLSFNQGEALIRIAQTYITLLEVILEAVQNALDVNATRIKIVLNRQLRYIVIRDNGDGVNQDDFEKALVSVGCSGKEKNKLGEYGIGLIAPLGKCREFSFTSCPADTKQGYIEWTFNVAQLRKQTEQVHIPMKKRPDLAYQARPVQRGRHVYVDWKTEIRIDDFTKDRIINRVTMDSLVENILDRYGAVMRRNSVVVSIKLTAEDGSEEIRDRVQAKLFTGKKLDEVTISDNHAGDTIFRLYLARKTTQGRKGKVLVGKADNDYRFGFGIFVRSAYEWLSKEVIATINSGIFEGEILTSNCTLNPSRKSFATDEALVGFCAAMEEWHGKVGKEHLKEVNEARADQRYQDLGLSSMKALEALLKNPQFEGIKDVINGFKRGSIGTGHSRSEKDKMAGDQKTGSLSTGGGQGGKRKPKDGSKSRNRQTSNKDNSEHTPYTVTGPSGNRRSVVKSNSLGLQFSHEAMVGSDKLWELDIRTGSLHFNIRHPTWVECEEDDKAVMRLQELIAVQALTLHSMPAEWQETQRLVLDEAISAHAFLLTSSPSFVTKRVPKAKKPK